MRGVIGMNNIIWNLKKAKNLMSIMVVMIFLCVTLLCIGCMKNQFLGDWEGIAQNTGDPPEIYFTLTITEENGEFKGVVSDTLGLLDNAPLQDVKIEKNVFSSAVVTTNEAAQHITLSATLDPKENTMSGEWEIAAQGAAGTWKCTKKTD
jgi:hypothetical protein